MNRSISDWVEYIQTLHARSIDLSLERVAEVYQRLLPKGVAFRVITVAGTNGKGSTCELIASMLRAAKISVANYSSPHLVSFNERFNIDGVNVSDDALLKAFEHVDEARGDVSLTFFEFGTLVAIELFAASKVEVAVMEVGLGGRLDAVNILEPDVAVVTNIAIDHTAWLGNTLDEIAFEKFGVSRSNTPCVIGMPEPPTSLLELAKKKNVPLKRVGVDFTIHLDEKGPEASNWSYRSGTKSILSLPLPYRQVGHQLLNSAAAIAAINELGEGFELSEDQIKLGISQAANPARCQVIATDPMIILDVAHNVASVEALASMLARLDVEGRMVAVCGMLADKQIDLALSEIADLIDVWHFASINNERGATSEFLAKSLSKVSDKQVITTEHDDVIGAFSVAREGLRANDCLVVFGSFFVAGDILARSINS